MSTCFTRSSRVRSWLGRLCILGASLVISALLLEGAVLLIFGERVKFPRHVVGAPWGLRINAPSSSYRHKSADVTVWFRINSQGMRAERDYSHAKPGGTKRIISLGDSYTIGYEVEREETFSSVLEQQLNAQGYQVEVLNAGVSGFSTAEEYLYLERELWKYDPDLVLVSFSVNDLVDNVRTNLFTLDEGRLVPVATEYVPAGGLGDFLNTNPFFNWLSERSNAFAFIKETVTLIVKRRMVEENVQNLQQVEGRPQGATPRRRHQEALTAALLERIYSEMRARDVPLIIQSIPRFARNPPRLVDLFPADFDVGRERLHYLSAKKLLEPYLGEELLYWTRSHWHWTPFSHRRSGMALARLISEHRLLD